MRKVLANNAQVAHYWANQTQSEGCSGSMFFEGNTIYSYGHHFPMGRVVNDRLTLITTKSYSNTTSKHISLAHGAARGTVMLVNDVTAESPREHAANVADLLARCTKALVQSKRARKNADWYMRDAVELYDTAVAYSKLFNLPEVAPMPDADAALAAAKRAASEKARIAREQEAAQRALMAVRVMEWRNGEERQLWNHPDTLLRVKGDTIQTSRGADMPIAHAPLIWATVQRCMRTGHEYVRNGHTLHAGVFIVDRIKPDGTLIAGCHTIAYAELERMAVTLGYAVTQHA